MSVYLAGLARTPIGREQGALKALEAWELGAFAIRGLVGGLPNLPVDRVVLANVTNGGNVARAAALGAGLPPGCSAFAVNSQCVGGLTAVRLGVEAITSGAAEVVVAGGAESVSRSIVDLGHKGARRSEEDWHRPHMVHAPPPYRDLEMGFAADMLSEQLGIDREAQDRQAFESFSRAMRSREDGVFAPATHPVTAEAGPVPADEMPRRVPAKETLARLPAAFRPNGTVTVGNTAPLGDGATAVLLASEAAVRRHRLVPLARVASAVAAAGEPDFPPLAAVCAAKEALAAAGLAAPGVSLWEVNEAFSLIVVAFIREFGLDPEAVNVNGGAVAFGHAFAASGATSLVHLVLEMRRRGCPAGLAAIAGAGGLGEAVILSSP